MHTKFSSTKFSYPTDPKFGSSYPKDTTTCSKYPKDPKDPKFDSSCTVPLVPVQLRTGTVTMMALYYWYDRS
eukprot:SAG11_NODE_5190_length_1634_cov_7.829967_1_plen_72_part_00